MFCLYCGNRLPEDAIFCNKCGKRQNVAVDKPDISATILPVPQMPGSTTNSGQPSISDVPMAPGTSSLSAGHAEQIFAQNDASTEISAPPPSGPLRAGPSRSSPPVPPQTGSSPSQNLLLHRQHQPHISDAQAFSSIVDSIAEDGSSMIIKKSN